VARVRTDVFEELIASIIWVTKIVELGTMLAVTSIRRTLLVIANVVLSSPILVTVLTEAIRSLEKSVLTTPTRCNISEEGILNFRVIKLQFVNIIANKDKDIYGNRSLKFFPDVGFEVFTTVTINNGVFWDPPCGSCKNRRLGLT
jgi:hypothetical protein